MAQNSLKKCFNLLEYIAEILFIMLSIFIVSTVLFIAISISRTLSVIPKNYLSFSNFDMLICAVLYFINFCSFLYYILSSEFIGFTLLFFFIAFLYFNIHIEDYEFSSKYCCCCCSVANSCPTFRDPTDSSTSGFPVPHHHS